MKTKYAFAAVVSAAALILSACGSSGSSNNTATTSGSGSAAGSGSSGAASGNGAITIGSAGFTENALLADIYADALTAKGVKVTKKLNIGERGVYIKALNEGGIDFIPEYTGSILTFFDTKATAKTPAEVFAALQKAVPSNLTVFKYAQAQDSDTITVSKNTASKYNLKTIADLAAVAGKLTFGGPAQFKTRADGIPALKSVYGVEFGRFTPLGTTGTIVVQALKSGSIDAADIFSTDASIVANGFVSLEDPKSMFAAQNIVPLINKSKVTPAITDTVNAVSAKLDTKTLAGLVAKVGTGDPDKVAKDWLSSNGLG
ncbi:MAG: ABC transporter substrate-binding protein [Actinomycetota bacterium]|nr:ABC transporter substrate-binding protein [Actinomycetota bacterium]